MSSLADPAIIERVYATLKKAAEAPEFRTALSSDGSEVVFNTPAEFARMIDAEHVKWAKVVKASGAKVD